MNQVASITSARWADMSVSAKTSAITEMAQLGLTASKMAVALGATRNMVLSHAHRKQIALARPVARVIKPKPVSTHVAPIKLRVHSSVPAITWEPHREPVGLLELATHSCRWPVGEAGGSKQMFCGDRAGRRGYCERHWKMRGGSCATHAPTNPGALQAKPGNPSKTGNPMAHENLRRHR